MGTARVQRGYSKGIATVHQGYTKRGHEGGHEEGHEGATREAMREATREAMREARVVDHATRGLQELVAQCT